MTGFAYPFTGTYPVSSPFGWRGDPPSLHTGVDFALPSGTPVLAASDGTIVYATFEAAAGNTVTVAAGDGMQSRYHHLAAFALPIGATVRQGEVIGWSDNTGNSTGPHLHFEIRTDPSTPVDPMPYLTTPAPPAPTTGDDDTMLIGLWNGRAWVIQAGVVIHECSGTQNAFGIPKEAEDAIRRGAQWTPLTEADVHALAVRSAGG